MEDTNKTIQNKDRKEYMRNYMRNYMRAKRAGIKPPSEKEVLNDEILELRDLVDKLEKENNYLKGVIDKILDKSIS